MAYPVASRESQGATYAKGTPSSAYVKGAPLAYREQPPGGALTARELQLMHAYWRACNYLAVGMIYLKDNPLLRRPLQIDDIKYRLLGHWGASPTLSFAWIHLNRLIVK